MAVQTPPTVDELLTELKEREIPAVVALEAGARLLAEQDPQQAMAMMALGLGGGAGSLGLG